MKVIFFIFLMGLTVSCLYDRVSHENFIAPVRIDSIYIPPVAEVSKSVGISVHAWAENGCWKNIHFRLTTKNSNEHEIKAFGHYESYGACPDVLVGKDSLIQFTPEIKGKHFFYTTISPGNLKIDTMLVK
jgi:hypothetical protein